MNNNLRATAQDLFLALLEYDDHIMPQIFVQIMNDRSTHFNQRINSSNASMNELVELAKQMDGIWTAAGLDTSLLKQSLNYDEWFMNSLVPVITSALNQAQQNGGGNSNSSSSNSNINLSGSNSIVAVHTTPYQRIIQYRALWLIGCLTYELADNVYAPVYKSLMQLLAIQDVVVCVATIAALRSMVTFYFPPPHCLSTIYIKQAQIFLTNFYLRTFLIFRLIMLVLGVIHLHHKMAVQKNS